MVHVYSYNVVTEDKFWMGSFETDAEAREACAFENLEWDPEDTISEWQILFTEDHENFEIFMDFTLDSEMDWEEWEEEDVDECGFDPYEGCYTYDC